jgi:glutamate/tyrosine decarboxylase-like PLP-dependent enzyme
MVLCILGSGGFSGETRNNFPRTLNSNYITLAVSSLEIFKKLMKGTEETYTLNFSRPGAHVIAQYYNFIHLGIDGYSSIQKRSLTNARFLSKALELTGCIPPNPKVYPDM